MIQTSDIPPIIGAYHVFVIFSTYREFLLHFFIITFKHTPYSKLSLLLLPLKYYSFSQPMPSDPASSVLPSLPAFLSSAPPVYPSSDYIPCQSDADAHLTSRQVPTPDIILSDAPANISFSTFHTFQSDTLSLPGGTGLDNTDRPLLKYN